MEIAVQPYIAPQDLFQLVRAKSGYGEAALLQQYDYDINDWVIVYSARDVVSEDKAKFQVVRMYLRS